MRFQACSSFCQPLLFQKYRPILSSNPDRIDDSSFSLECIIAVTLLCQRWIDGHDEKTEIDGHGNKTEIDGHGEETEIDEHGQKTEIDRHGKKTEKDGCGEKTEIDGRGEEFFNKKAWNLISLGKQFLSTSGS